MHYVKGKTDQASELLGLNRGTLRRNSNSTTCSGSDGWQTRSPGPAKARGLGL